MGCLIAIEGIDGSGKGTQARLLVARLKTEGHSAALIGFPRYDATFFGEQIGGFLNGRFGSLESVHPFLAALLFAGDRFESKQMLMDAIALHEFVVLDRYVASNVAHQAAKATGKERITLQQAIERLEFDLYGLPHANRVILLDLPVLEAQRLIAKKSPRTYTDRAADLQEADGAYLEQVRSVYRSLAEGNAAWSTIHCLRGKTVRDVTDIHDELYKLALS